MPHPENPHHPKQEEEAQPKIVEISRSSMDFLNKFKQDLIALDNWLYNSKKVVERLGQAHLAGKTGDMRAAQNELWQSFRKEIWEKNLFAETETFSGEDAEKRMLLENIKKSLTISETYQGKTEIKLLTSIPPDELRKNLYAQMEQHWMAGEYLNEKKQPKKLDEFVFRISLWMSDVIQIKHTVENLINQCQIKTS